MILRNLGIRHFRSLYDAELSLKPLTIVIGPNASGKTNLFKALRFLHVAVAGDIKDWTAYGAQLDDLLWYGRSASGGPRPDDLQFATGFGTCASSNLFNEYRIRFQVIGSIRISEENLGERDPVRGNRNLILRSGDEIRFPEGWPVSPLFNPSDTPFLQMPVVARSRQSLTLRELGPGIREPLAVRDVYQNIAGWRFFDIDPRLARQSHFINPDPEEVPPLESDASNLSAFLYALRRLRPDDLDVVIEAVLRSIELPQDVLIEHDAQRGGHQAQYRFIEAPFGEDRPIPPESLSDGTIRFLAQMALLLADHTVSLACLEEPDAGLHPRLMIHLADALRQAIQVKTPDGAERQILVTTHSPELMDCFDLESEADYLQVYVAERDETGQTRFIPASAQELAPWLEKYRLGEAVRRRFV
ncbi:MAG TPA: AAA family ATPase [Thermoanaerobaculia bacterium]|nr:AAA family ATPase [Thermoanaerobaculia bacterium]